MDGHGGRTTALGGERNRENCGRRHLPAWTRVSARPVHAALHRAHRRRRAGDAHHRSPDRMSELYSFGLPEVIAGLIVVALCGYAVTGGADFGGGVWDLLASGPRRREQQEFIARSLAPI